MKWLQSVRQIPSNHINIVLFVVTATDGRIKPDSISLTSQVDIPKNHQKVGPNKNKNV